MQKSPEAPKSEGSKVVQWRLAAGKDRRFKSGHPWVYSNELTASPKGIEPGAAVELRDAGGGKVLARGYGNPGSLIAFRALTRAEADVEPHSALGLEIRLGRALRARLALGLGAASFRWCFGEADQLPGLVIDRFLLESGDPVLVAQAHTAGAERWLAELPGVLERVFAASPWGAAGWERATLIVRDDVGVRKLEGLATDGGSKVVKGPVGLNLAEARIIAPGWAPGGRVYSADLKDGQKTGFFLDQWANVSRFAQLARDWASAGSASGSRRVRVLDLCCYAGQWGASVAAALIEGGVADVEVTAVDSSARALELARANVAAAGARCETMKADVLHGLEGLPASSFDIVISDPPALVKGRKDLGPGRHAYLQLHTQAIRLVRDGGLVAACSCSALLPEEEFAATLARAAQRGSAHVRWVARGGQAPDHPVLAEFPEGQYLKCWMGIVEK